MKLIVKIKLQTTPETDRLLRETVARYQHVCNHLSAVAFANRMFERFALQRLCYHDTKGRFALPAQLLIRALAEVCAAYKTLLAQIKAHNRDCQPEERRELTQVTFAPNLALPYDPRILAYCANDRVSLRLLHNRVTFDFQAGAERKSLLALPRGQADLKRFGKEWFLLQTVTVPDPEPLEAENCVGVDCGLNTVASSFDGQETLRFSGHAVRQIRRHHSQLRRGLQRHNTKSSRRRVRKLRDRESRRVRNLNHLISRRIVTQAQRTKAAIVLEDLEGINAGLRVRQGQRYERFSWAYFELQQLLVYKAAMAGLPVVFVPPAYTSQTCSRCGYCHPANRPTQARFVCQECGYKTHADDNAAANIRFLGGASTAQKRTVAMQEFLHRDCRKPPGFSPCGS